jgi:hypothetical protein
MSLIARMRLRSTLIMSPSVGSASAWRSCGDTARPCRMTRPSPVRKIEDAARSSPSVQTSSTRNFTIVSRRCGVNSVRAEFASRGSDWQRCTADCQVASMDPLWLRRRDGSCLMVELMRRNRLASACGNDVETGRASSVCSIRRARAGPFVLAAGGAAMAFRTNDTTERR